MNARKRYRHSNVVGFCLISMLLPVVSVSGAKAVSVHEMLGQGNGLYDDGKYVEAINKYNEVLVERPQALEPKFNKANSYYRLDDLGEAIDLYKEVAAESKDMPLVTRAKYNLGNCFFQQGSRERDSDLQKALEDMKTSITYWRQVLDIDPKNEKAARNIEVARLTIKDILDQLKQQQKNQQNQQDPNQPRQQDQEKQENQSQPQQDPNEPQDPNQPQPNQPQDPNQVNDQQQPQPQEQDERQQEQKIVPDATAQEILDHEQRQKKEREILQSRRYQEVEKDW